MKNRILIAVLVVLGMAPSCDLTEVNIDPNSPVEVPLQTLLPPAITGIARIQAGDILHYTNIFSQHLEGTFAQELQIENYAVDELFVGYMWSDMFAGPMINLHLIMEQATEENAPHYAGMARILMAYCLGTLTDMWGDIPYSEAFMGDANLSPAYDPQEQLYATIQQLLDDGIANLNASESSSSPAGDDLLYSGDRNAWIQAAHALKARYFLHTAKVDASAYVNALDALSGGFSTADAGMVYRFLGTEADANPIHLYYQTTPYLNIDQQFLGYLNSTADPRKPFLVQKRTGATDTIIGTYYGSIGSPVTLISYTEQLLIQAECQLAAGAAADAEISLQQAVSLHMEEVSGGSITAEQRDDYLNANAVLDGTTDENWAVLMQQKWVCMFTHPEAWVDYRRTGNPALSPNPFGATAVNPGGAIPRRLIYPQIERLQNNNVPQPLPDMQTRCWWDL